MTLEILLEVIPKIKKLPLPGTSSQFKLSPPFRTALIEKYKEAMKDAKKAAVVAIIFPKGIQKELHIALILRKAYKGVHSAQIGFPGGKLELGESLKQAAIREVEEEIGISASQYDIVKQMTEVYIPPSNFYVQSFLGISDQELKFIKQDEEVEEVVEVALSELLDDVNVKDSLVQTSLKRDLNVPSFILEGHIVWGATAMMLSEIKDLLKELL